MLQLCRILKWSLGNKKFFFTGTLSTKKHISSLKAFFYFFTLRVWLIKGTLVVFFLLNLGCWDRIPASNAKKSNLPGFF